MPNPSGLPILGFINDGNAGPCSGNIELVQLSKLAAIGTGATNANTLITPASNCLTSLGIAPGDINAPSNSWSGHLTNSTDGHNDGTWKGAVAAFRNNILLAYFFRQTSAGDAFGGSTLILSPDAGNTWIDYGRYNTYAVTGATCSNGVVTMAASNLLQGTEKMYIHDINPAGYGGKQTLTSATGSTVTYTLKDVFGNARSCPGAYVSGGSFGILSANGSAPLGPSDAGFPSTMMWPNGGQMANPTPIDYGQDGNYPAGIESACDPTVWVCGMDIRSVNSGTATMGLFRVPVGREMDKSQYQWYKCAGYGSAWPSIGAVCDGNMTSAWSSNPSDETILLNVGRFGRGTSAQGPCVGGVTYLPEFKSYVLSCNQESYKFAGPRYGYMTAPHPWGPWYPTYLGCVNCVGGFLRLMPSQRVVVSSDPPALKYRVPNSIGIGTDGYPSGGVAAWSSVELNIGKLPPLGMARTGYTLGEFGQINMGHRFTSGLMAGALPLRGVGLGGGPYKVDWWTDLYLHGGDANASLVTQFPNLVDPADSFTAYCNQGMGWTVPGYCGGGSISSVGVNAALAPSFADRGTFGGNKSWTYVEVLQVGGAYGPSLDGGSLNTLMLLHPAPINIANCGTNGVLCGVNLVELGIYMGLRSANDIGVRFGTANSVKADFTTPGSVVPSTTKLIFVAVTAKANNSGYPTITIFVGHDGTITEYGGADLLSTAANGTSAAGINKTCGGSCTTTPNISAGLNYWMNFTPTSYGSYASVQGEHGVYSGALPSHAIREIYRTLRADWARVGRGSL
jgi:hypothetical protein